MKKLFIKASILGVALVGIQAQAAGVYLGFGDADRLGVVLPSLAPEMDLVIGGAYYSTSKTRSRYEIGGELHAELASAGATGFVVTPGISYESSKDEGQDAVSGLDFSAGVGVTYKLGDNLKVGGEVVSTYELERGAEPSSLRLFQGTNFYATYMF